ncbi:MAG: GatB/YqeY domain-containing protein [Peptostreptococcaceae bacterium]|jgi:gatB/yqey family protein|nr:GatB/YqeY domain-containing protein [Peptostreptococcaceae bacterium]
MNLKEQLTNDLKESMKNKEQVKKSVVTLIRAAIKQKEVDERVELNDEAVLDIISKQMKQRNDALEEFKKAGRDDLISQTEEEIQVLLSYLPKQLTDDELRVLIKEAIDKTGASSSKDMGKIMGILMPKTKGKADGKRINTLVSEFFK